jgi:Rps23 Pro-64 3,4-dihydroxylase Tpa1-like proline 4-hydroxylase
MEIGNSQNMIQSTEELQRSRDMPVLNPELDHVVLAEQFERHGRVQIQRVLSKSSAQRIYSCLAEETRYELCTNEGEETRVIANPTPAQRQEFTKAAWGRVGTHAFQFLYDRHTLSLDGEAYPDQDHYLAKVTNFLNGAEFLNFVRGVTGMKAIALADAQATLYRAGHFLTVHEDNKPGPNRLVAYVLSLTALWRPEWGGLLEFVNEANQIEDGFVPNFNSLRLFRIPTKHYVSYVAPFAQAGRYSITGWLRAR